MEAPQSVALPTPRPTLLGRIATVVLLIFFAFIFLRMVGDPVFGNPITDNANAFVRGVNALSLLAIPFLLSFFPIYPAARRIKVYEEFVEGAKEGFNVIRASFRFWSRSWLPLECLKARAESIC